MMTTPQNAKPSDNPLLKFGMYNLPELKEFNAKAATQQFLVDGLIGQQSLSLGVGDSNCGKSPFFYQMAVCVAARVPFLGMPVKQGCVLYMDAENSTGQVEQLVTTLAEYVGLEEAPRDLLLFNKNNCPEGHSLAEIVEAAKPVLVILDPIYAYFPDIEEKPRAVTEAYQQLRELMKAHGCAFIGIHHITKETEHPGAAKRQALDAISDQRRWFTRTRGSGALINGCDNRLGFDLPTVRDDCKLVVGGFARVRGAFPLMRLTRDLDADGEPRGYRRLSGVDLLRPDWRAVYENLPDGYFRFKDVKPRFEDKSDAADSFLKACVAADVLEHDVTIKPKGAYRKKSPVPTEAPAMVS